MSWEEVDEILEDYGVTRAIRKQIGEEHGVLRAELDEAAAAAAAAETVAAAQPLEPPEPDLQETHEPKAADDEPAFSLMGSGFALVSDSESSGSGDSDSEAAGVDEQPNPSQQASSSLNAFATAEAAEAAGSQATVQLYAVAARELMEAVASNMHNPLISQVLKERAAIATERAGFAEPTARSPEPYHSPLDSRNEAASASEFEAARLNLHMTKAQEEAAIKTGGRSSPSTRDAQEAFDEAISKNIRLNALLLLGRLHSAKTGNSEQALIYYDQIVEAVTLAKRDRRYWSLKSSALVSKANIPEADKQDVLVFLSQVRRKQQRQTEIVQLQLEQMISIDENRLFGEFGVIRA